MSEKGPTYDIPCSLEIPFKVAAACLNNGQDGKGCGILFSSDTGKQIDRQVAEILAEIHRFANPDHRVCVLKKRLPC